MNQEAYQKMDLGYVFHPPQKEGQVGHPQLDVFLRPKPTYKHFDPEEVHVSLIVPYEGLHRVTIRHPWLGQNEYQLYPGRLRMVDRLAKVEEAFSFGGQVEIDTIEEQTTVIIRSEAPIFGPLYDENLGALLAEETESLLDDLKDKWEQDPDKLDERLISAGPKALYLACVESLRKKHTHLPTPEEEHLRRFVHFLNDESRKYLKDTELKAKAEQIRELL